MCEIYIHKYTVTKCIAATLNYCSQLIFSERSLYAIARPSVVRRLSVYRLSSVTFVRPTQAVQIFGNISMALGTLAIH